MLSVSCLEKIHFIYFIGAGGIKLFCYHVWKKIHFKTFSGHTVIWSLIAVDNKTVIFITTHIKKQQVIIQIKKINTGKYIYGKYILVSIYVHIYVYMYTYICIYIQED